MGRILQIACGLVLALALTGASPRQGGAEVLQENTAKAAEHTRAAQSPAPPPALDSGAEPAHLYDPCKPGEDQRQSDLCAQWKAADSASEAAFWTQAGFWVGAVGTVVGFITVIALLESIRQGRESLRIASSALQVAVAENRPWLVVHLEACGPATYHGKVRVPVRITLKNHGAWPAFRVRHAISGGIFDWARTDSGPILARAEAAASELESGPTIFNAQPVTFTTWVEIDPEGFPNKPPFIIRLMGVAYYSWMDGSHGKVSYQAGMNVMGGGGFSLESLSVKGGLETTLHQDFGLGAFD